MEKVESRTLIVRPYNAIAALAGGFLGVVLGILSRSGALEGIDPFIRGVIGLVISALIGIIVSRLPGVHNGQPSRGVAIESAISSALAAIVVWPIVYAMLS